MGQKGGRFVWTLPFGTGSQVSYPPKFSKLNVKQRITIEYHSVTKELAFYIDNESPMLSKTNPKAGFRTGDVLVLTNVHNPALGTIENFTFEENTTDGLLGRFLGDAANGDC